MNTKIEEIKKRIMNPLDCTTEQSKEMLLCCIDIIEQQQAEIQNLKEQLICNGDKLAVEAHDCIDKLRLAYGKSGLSHFEDAIDIITRLTGNKSSNHKR